MSNATKTETFATGDFVHAGSTPEDYDKGEVVAVDGDLVTVAWFGCNETTTQPSTCLASHPAHA